MKITIRKAKEIAENKLTYALVFTTFNHEKWVMVRHRERTTWEVPAGHIEPGEKPADAAKRELYEETGAVCYNIIPLFDYSVRKGLSKRSGRVYWCNLEKMGVLPESEIAEVRLFEAFPDKPNLTYPEIQGALLTEVRNKLKGLISI
jgi:8-oxo-dGTP diphosphatase